MRKLLAFGFTCVFLVLGALFVYQWSRTTAVGVGTGRIAGENGDLPARTSNSDAEKASNLAKIVQNPAAYAGKTVALKGRVRGPLRLASNRTAYRLIDASGQHSLLVVDDRAAPKEYWSRSVSGQVKLLKAPIGNIQYPYIVSLQSGAKYDLTWKDAKIFFTDKFEDIERGAKEVAKNVAR